MAYRQLGDPYRALLYYAAAVRWMEKQPPDDELRRFRAEAAGVLGVADGPPAQDRSPPMP